MYLGLGVNTRKTVFHSEYVFAEKNTSSIMTRHRFCGRVSMVMIRHCLFVSTLLRESILRKRSYDITAVELLGLCADHAVLCIIVRNG